MPLNIDSISIQNSSTVVVFVAMQPNEKKTIHTQPNRKKQQQQHKGDIHRMRPKQHTTHTKIPPTIIDLTSIKQIKLEL